MGEGQGKAVFHQGLSAEDHAKLHRCWIGEILTALSRPGFWQFDPIVGVRLQAFQADGRDIEIWCKLRLCGESNRAVTLFAAICPKIDCSACSSCQNSPPCRTSRHILVERDMLFQHVPAHPRSYRPDWLPHPCGQTARSSIGNPYRCGDR